jgi:hypothetical protein
VEVDQGPSTSSDQHGVVRYDQSGSSMAWTWLVLSTTGTGPGRTSRSSLLTILDTHSHSQITIHRCPLVDSHHLEGEAGWTCPWRSRGSRWSDGTSRSGRTSGSGFSTVSLLPSRTCWTSPTLPPRLTLETGTAGSTSGTCRTGDRGTVLAVLTVHSILPRLAGRSLRTLRTWGTSRSLGTRDGGGSDGGAHRSGHTLDHIGLDTGGEEGQVDGQSHQGSEGDQ